MEFEEEHKDKTKENIEKKISNTKEENIEKTEEEKKERDLEIEKKIRDWFEKQGWKGNPFVLSVISSIFVGCEEEKNRLISAIEENHKVTLLLGPTGSGKTTALKWLEKRFEKNNKIVKFVSKPPEDLNSLIELFNNIFKPIWPLSIFSKKIKIIHELPDFLNKKLKNKTLVLLLDEAHEASINILQWLRVLIDQTENLCIVMSALPNFEDVLTKKLETFHKRITTKIVLKPLSEKDTEDLILKRIEYVGKGPHAKNPFTKDAIKVIYEETGGFPREILRLCDFAINKAIEKNLDKIDAEIFREKEKEPIAQFSIDSMPRRQKEVLEAIIENKNTPNEILEYIDLSKYKSRYHALRSVNNILQRLIKEGYVERRKHGKTYYYTLSPKLRTLLVKA